MHIERLKKIGDNVLVGATGEYSDFQEIIKLLEQLVYASRASRIASRCKHVVQCGSRQCALCR